MDQDETALIQSKIPESRLRDHATSDPPGSTMSVIVELARPEPRFVYEPAADDKGSPRPVAVEPLPPDDQGTADVIDQVRRTLEELGVEDPVYLRSAGAFACDLDSAQIKAVAQIPGVVRIVENRVLS